jgi:hypothetical protein
VSEGIPVILEKNSFPKTTDLRNIPTRIKIRTLQIPDKGEIFLLFFI